MIRGLELFYVFGVLDDYGKLVDFIGINMVEFLIDLMIVKIFLLFGKFGCFEEILFIVVMF